MDNDKIDQIIDKHQAEPSSLIQVMLEIQSENNWLPKETLDRISERLAVPLARILHIATFYKAFSLVPKGRHGVHICVGTACHVRGASRILDTVQEKNRHKTRRNRPGSEIQPGGCELPRLLCVGTCDGNQWENPWQNDAGRNSRSVKKL